MAISKGHGRPLRAICLLALTDSGAPFSMSDAHPSAVSMSLDCGTTSLTRPIRYASWAGIRLPVSIMPIATFSGTCLGSR